MSKRNRVYEMFEVYESLLRERPHYVRGHIQLGLLCIKMGVTSRGIEYLRAALANQPTTAEKLLIESLIEQHVSLVHKRYHRPDLQALSHVGGPM